MNQRTRSISKLLTDAVLWTAATPLAFALRFDGGIPQSFLEAAMWTTGLLALVKLLVIWRLRLHRQTWAKVSLRDLYDVLLGVAIVVVAASAFAYFLRDWIRVPRSVPVLEALIASAFLISPRVVVRLLGQRSRRGVGVQSGTRRVLIIGAGEAGTMIAREMHRHPETGLVPIGFLDDDPGKSPMRIAGVPVLGRISDLEVATAAHEVDEVLIAIPSAEGRVVRRILERTRKLSRPIKYRIIPGVYELLGESVSIDRIREVQVEDLLRRPPVHLNVSSIAETIEGRTVLVTGAGGSIGSELVRQLARFHPALVVLLGRGENSIFAIERELDRDWPDTAYRSIIADVRDRDRLDWVFDTFEPGTVVHAAAHKHVPLMEANPTEAILNNVLGTRNLVQLAVERDVDRFVNVSTDKAVNPTSIMGASKRMAEYVVQAAAASVGDDRAFVSVRFGNVLGSRGSVIPLFMDQIRAGGPVTVTHPDMRRYFMTIPEASQLVLQAGAMEGNGRVYVLDMGDPVKIVDLASDLIRLAGREPGRDVEIVFQGTRPGEKLYEELMTDVEKTRITPHSKIFASAQLPIDAAAVDAVVEALVAAARRGDAAEVRRLLSSFVPGAALPVVKA